MRRQVALTVDVTCAFCHFDETDDVFVHPPKQTLKAVKTTTKIAAS